MKGTDPNVSCTKFEWIWKTWVFKRFLASRFGFIIAMPDYENSTLPNWPELCTTFVWLIREMIIQRSLSKIQNDPERTFYSIGTFTFGIRNKAGGIGIKAGISEKSSL